MYLPDDPVNEAAGSKRIGITEMKQAKTGILRIFTVIVICVLLSAGCQAPGQGREASDAATQSETKIGEIRERGVLKVGTAGDYMPMSYLDPETGRYVGFDTELAEDLAEALGVKLEYAETSWRHRSLSIRLHKGNLGSSCRKVRKICWSM